MRTFTTIWFGQLVSTIGSYMTHFAITIWVWESTGKATSLALVLFFGYISSILANIVGGTIVDRYNRKLLIMVGDGLVALSTVSILLLLLTGQLQIWHLYFIEAVNGIFLEIQELAYSVAISTMVPKKHYTRASSMGSMLHYGSSIFAPALGGVLYYIIGLGGILAIDLATFGVAIATVAFLPIPQAEIESKTLTFKAVIQDAVYGWRYIYQNSFLLPLLLWGSLFWLIHDLGGSIYAATILARSGNDAAVLASLSSAAGIGGVVGAVIITAWGGSKNPINSFFGGMIGAGLSKTIFGLGQSASVWIPAQFCSSLNFPWLGSADDAMWMENVEAEDRGRVFAARSLIRLIVGAIASLMAGYLADSIFEPAMRSGGVLAPIFGGIFGTGAGAGMALFYTITAIALLAVGIGGFTVFKRS
ncbi:MFS transporter [Merismopedia glauca]|uniref:MFS transporter n=1 Tax=Merismopedia glauca CCAP 1448/3 TaxID=1296344 RepID=A0A2T1BZN2_9CYAN|nr:MFS transporter [Merismopedia glauca]PSB01377.1 MFS transporter [Merismopedia glauca CCAP 1448/3]